MSPVAVWLLAAAVLGAVLGALGIYAVAFSLRKEGEAEKIQEREELKGQFALLSQEALKGAASQLLDLASERLSAERAKGTAELDERRRAVETAVSALSERLKSAEELIRELERDRDKKFGSLEEQLKHAASTTEQLGKTAEGLRAMLANSRQRGQWGERMAEDILRAAGLQENLQYLKNRVQETINTRPDFTFLLPDGRKLHMDVKFPLDNYVRMSEAAQQAEKDRFRNEFVKDARARVRELGSRDYVNPIEGTLDYVLCFIPNEQVYGYLNDIAPGLLDEALAKKVVLCSPTTLYAVLSVVRQAHDNFRMAKATREVIQLVAAFRQNYDKFRERFEKLGEQLSRTQDAYGEIAGASFKRLEQSVAKIDQIGKEQALEAAAPSVPPVLPHAPADN